MGDSLMESRGQKRLAEELPGDKRTCNSLEFRPSSSSMMPEILDASTSSVFEAHEADMQTSSSSASASEHTDDDEERDSPYNSGDEDDDGNDGDPRYSSLREYQRNRSQGDSAKLKALLSCLSNKAEPSGQLASLTELCELLSFSTSESISSTLADHLATILVKLANHEDNPETMLLAIRALTYLCDLLPHSSSSLVKHDAVPALCQRLMVIEYLDVAEQCLQALEKISRDQPLPCLQSGAIMAVLGYIDFFSTTVQRTALCTVLNICKRLPAECPTPVMEAVPRLCNLLQYEDQQLVEIVASCLMKIVDRVKGSPEMLSELYRHGLIAQVTQLLELNSRITLSQPTYTGLIGVVGQIASGSADAVGTLFELNIGSILKDVLFNPELSHGVLSHVTENNFDQVREILKLLHEILPEVATDKKEGFPSSKENLLLDQPDQLHKFGMNIFPALVQVVGSGSDLVVCYGCLSVISRLVYFSKSESLFEIFKGINIASFLAGVFTRNDHHILSLALQITDSVLEKLSEILMQAFIKEGVLFAIDALFMPESTSQLTSPMVNCIKSKKNAGREAKRCLCYTYCSSQPESTTKSKPCKLDKKSFHKIAEQIKTKYFSAELCSSQNMVTDVLQGLRDASAAINDLLKMCSSREASPHIEDKLCHILGKVILQLTGDEPISTFELIESNIVKALLNYISNGQYPRSYVPDDDVRHAYDVQKRFEAFARIMFTLPNPDSKDLPISLFVRKLQSALSTVETFPAIVGYATRQRGSYATVPRRCHTTYPCLSVQFVRGKEELYLNDYGTEAVTVDPFCQVDEIEKHLLSRVWKKVDVSEGRPQAIIKPEMVSIEILVDPTSLSEKSTEHMTSASLCHASPDMQERDGKSHQSAMEISGSGLNRSKVVNEAESGPSEDEIHSSDRKANLLATFSTWLSADEENSKKLHCQASLAIEDPPSKLMMYLDGELLSNSSSLYQEILQRQMKSHNRLQISKLWSSTYTITYRRVTGNLTRSGKEQDNLPDGPPDKVLLLQEIMPLFSSSFGLRLGSVVDPSSPASDILYLLKSLELTNRFAYHLLSYERLNAFAKGKLDDLDNLKVVAPTRLQYEFVNNRLTEKLEQQLRDPLAMHIGATPLWCKQLMAGCPFLFSFEARCKYFHLAAFNRLQVAPNMSAHNDSDGFRERRAFASTLPRKKLHVCRDRVLESAAQMMELYTDKKVVIEVEYSEEVGTGLGPTLEFYTIVSHEFQKASLGMWRGDHMSPSKSSPNQGTSSGLFPRPWSPKLSTVKGIEFSDVVESFILLGQFVGRALQEGRVLDIPFSKAFYKLVLGKELSVCDIQSFDPGLGRILLEFKALASRRKCLELVSMEDVAHSVCSGFRDSKIEDLCLDFTLPGYHEYILAAGMDDVMVTSNNLEEYISMVLDATLYAGISRQVEAFKSGLNQVFSEKLLHSFTEEELERLLCGERDSWMSCDLFDHIKFDHGYTAGSTQIINLLEIISDFDYEQRRGFLQFVTGAPRLPPGGLAALNPKLTIVRKHSSNSVDADLPSVMTCANYLKLPPYSSKEKMKEKILYAIIEGQGSFHLS